MERDPLVVKFMKEGFTKCKSPHP